MDYVEMMMDSNDKLKDYLGEALEKSANAMGDTAHFAKRIGKMMREFGGRIKQSRSEDILIQVDKIESYIKQIMVLAEAMERSAYARIKYEGRAIIIERELEARKNPLCDGTRGVPSSNAQTRHHYETKAEKTLRDAS